MADKSMEYIIMISECKSVLRASENLGITTSALSKAVQKVEGEYGIHLFQRVGKSFQPTYAGLRFIEWSKRIIDAENKMNQEMLNATSKQFDRINIGSTEVYDELIINEVLPAFRANYPQTEIYLYKRTRPSLLKELAAGRIDLIVSLFPDIPDGYSSKIIKNEELCLMMSANSSLLKKTVEKKGFNYQWIEFSDVLEEDFITLPKGRRLRGLLENLFYKYGREPNISIEVTNTYDMLQFVSLDLGLGLNYPSLVERDWGDRIVPVSFGENKVYCSHAIVWKPDASRDKPIDEIIRLCSEVLVKTLNK